MENKGCCTLVLVGAAFILLLLVGAAQQLFHAVGVGIVFLLKWALILGGIALGIAVLAKLFGK